MEWCITSVLSWIQLLDMAIAIFLFCASLVILDSPNGLYDSHTHHNFIFHVLVPSIVIAVLTYLGIFCFSILRQNKVLKKAPVIKIMQVTKEENPDHLSSRYIYHITDSKNIVYKVESNKKINFKKYTVKIPYDKAFGEYIYLFKNSKYVKDYMLAEMPYKTVNE